MFFFSFDVKVLLNSLVEARILVLIIIDHTSVTNRSDVLVIDGCDVIVVIGNNVIEVDGCGVIEKQRQVIRTGDSILRANRIRLLDITDMCHECTQCA